MIEIDYKEQEKVDNLYEEIKKIILTKKNNESFKYNCKRHHLYEESEIPGISQNYYNENGSVEFENINGDIILLEISRWHPHKHNGFSGLNATPCLTARIYINEQEEKKVLWELIVKSGTLYYKAEVSNLEIPNGILQEKEEVEINDNQEVEVETEVEIIEPSETRILLDEIARLHNQYESAEQTKEKILIKRKKELEEVTKKINESYSQKLAENKDDITISKKQLNDFEKLLTKYSTFNIDLVGKAFQQLISITESKEYIYQQVIHNSKKRVHGVIDSWDEDIQTKASIIVRKDKLLNCYESTSQNEINKLITNGDVLLLNEQDITNRNNKKIDFYTSQDGQIFCHVNYGRFDYIKKFIDDIVQYRFQHSIIEFSEKDMLLFIKKYLTDNKDIIIKNYSAEIEEKVLNLKLSNTE